MCAIDPVCLFCHLGHKNIFLSTSSPIIDKFLNSWLSNFIIQIVDVLPYSTKWNPHLKLSYLPVFRFSSFHNRNGETIFQAILYIYLLFYSLQNGWLIYITSLAMWYILITDLHLSSTTYTRPAVTGSILWSTNRVTSGKKTSILLWALF